MDAWPTDGSIIKNAADTFAPGGKTVNVARWLAKRGATVACGGLLGEDNAAMFEKELAKYGIEDRFMRIPGSTTRRNSRHFLILSMGKGGLNVPGTSDGVRVLRLAGVGIAKGCD